MKRNCSLYSCRWSPAIVWRFLGGLMLLAILLPAALFAMSSITAGDMVITSRLMTMQGNVYVVRGGMKAEQKDSVLEADRGIYDRTIEVVKAFDNVRITQPGSVLTADYLEAFVKEDRIVAQGNPKLVRIVERESKGEDGSVSKRKSRVILTCREVEGFNKENRFLAKGDVHVVEVAYREGETPQEAAENEKSPVSDLKCDSLEMFSREDKAIARDNVLIVTKTLRATGDKAIYLDRENRLIIVGHAHGYQTGREAPGAQEQVSEIYANKIIYYPNEDRTIAVGDVHATVYPKGQQSPFDDDAKKKKKKKKSEGETTATGTASTDSAGEDAEGGDDDRRALEDAASRAGMPTPGPGDLTPVGDAVIEAQSE
ncbi:MAG TPA: LptA/OstA family protein [Candidatus Ozemobacteraceae bacterium]|nr:LptA/OstA family protein [Candidatus Ozemobacteraceae bacterium]